MLDVCIKGLVKLMKQQTMTRVDAEAMREAGSPHRPSIPNFQTEEANGRGQRKRKIRRHAREHNYDESIRGGAGYEDSPATSE